MYRAQSIPERIGRYRILRECGHGGMGVVYEAKQESPSRSVALKVIRTGALSDELLRRFQHEAEVLGRLLHPGIAQIYEAGSFDVGGGGQPFFAMEFVHGEDLLKYAATHALDTKARLSLFALVCDAVHYAHQQGVIHRDLKPDNIMVVAPQPGTPVPRAEGTGGPCVESVGQPKILDFGIARLNDAEAQNSTMLTHAGQLMGTPQYMSPEQASQGACEVDVRSDVYTLGVVLFQLLADRPPYDLRKRSISDSIHIILHEDAPRLGSLDAGLKGDVELIVGKCLEKEPEGRYSTAAGLAEDLRRHLGNEPIGARPPGTWYRAKKFTLRNQALVGGTLATLVALVIGVIVSMIFAFRASESSKRASAYANRALESEASALRQVYVANLSAANALADSDPRAARELLDAAAETPAALAGWELKYLNTGLQRYARSYEADVASTGQITFIRGGTQLVSALVDGRVAVWDTLSTELVQIGAELSGTHVLALDAPRGGPPLIACGTQEGQVRIWDLDADRWIDVATKAGGIVDLEWDSSGRQLLFSTRSSVNLWRRGAPLREHRLEMVRAMTPPVRLGFSSDGERYSASTRSDNAGAILWWDAGTGKRLSDGSGNLRAAVPASGLSHDQARFAIAGGDGIRSCVLQDARTGETQVVLRGHNDYVGVVAWTPDDTRLLTSSRDGTIRFWDTTSGACLAVLSADPHSALAVAADGSGVAFRAEGVLRYWDFKLSSSMVLHPDVSFVYFLAYSPDGTRLAAASPHSSFTTLMDPLAARILRTIDVGAVSYGVVFSRDGARLDVGQANIDVASGAFASRPVVRIAEWLQPERWSARFSPGAVLSADGKYLARAAGGNRATNAVVRDIATGETMLEVEGDFWSVAFSPDRALLAAGHHEPGHVEIWSLVEGRKLLDLPAHGRDTYCVEFHPDGTRLATGGSDNTIRLWDTTTWEQVLVLRGHTSYVKSLVFSPDGTQLASGSGDLSVRIWDTVPRAERYRKALAAR